MHYDDDYKSGIASGTYYVYVGTPEDNKAILLHKGDKIPDGAKPRPWLLGKPSAPKTPPKKPVAKKTTGKKATGKK